MLPKEEQERIWLAQNKHSYPGLWIALDGDQLLAQGKTAEEVFNRVRGLPEPPLVIRIEEEAAPFGGW